MTVLVSVRGLKRWFNVSRGLRARLFPASRKWLRAVDGIDFDIERGTTLSLVGESGCGKSTVARMVVGLHRPSAGKVMFDGAEFSAMTGRSAQAATRRRLQMIFQDPFASLNPRWRVSDIVAEPLRSYGIAGTARETAARVAELLEQVGLAADDGAKYPHEFSGGQRQRISIARALSANPEFLVCDEPTSALDVSVQAQILNLMRDLQRERGLTYLFISHNLAVVQHVSDRVGVMYLGRLVEIGPAAEVFASPLHPYTRMLLETIPHLDAFDRPAGDERVPVAGEVPNPISPPTGCAFHPRCPVAGERCRVERPELEACGSVQVACHLLSGGTVTLE